MNCRTARRLMHELLDGDCADQSGLDSHLAECEACRAEMSRLRHVHESVAEAVGRPPDQPDLAEDMSGIWHAVRARGLGPAQPDRPRTWAAGAFGLAAALLFGLGLWAGGSLWPREVQVVRVVTETKIIEKSIEVPVVEERIVIQRVPVVKTRVVYRDRPVPATPGPQAGVPHEPVKADEVVVRLDAVPSSASSLVSHEIHSVTAVEQAPQSSRPAALPDELPEPGGEESATLIAWQPQSSAPTAERGN